MAVTKVGLLVAGRIKSRCSTGFIDKVYIFSLF